MNEWVTEEELVEVKLVFRSHFSSFNFYIISTDSLIYTTTTTTILSLFATVSNVHIKVHFTQIISTDIAIQFTIIIADYVVLLGKKTPSKIMTMWQQTCLITSGERGLWARATTCDTLYLFYKITAVLSDKDVSLSQTDFDYF